MMSLPWTSTNCHLAKDSIISIAPWNYAGAFKPNGILINVIVRGERQKRFFRDVHGDFHLPATCISVWCRENRCITKSVDRFVHGRNDEVSPMSTKFRRSSPRGVEVSRLSWILTKWMPPILFRPVCKHSSPTSGRSRGLQIPVHAGKPGMVLHGSGAHLEKLFQFCAFIIYFNPNVYLTCVEILKACLKSGPHTLSNPQMFVLRFFNCFSMFSTFTCCVCLSFWVRQFVGSWNVLTALSKFRIWGVMGASIRVDGVTICFLPTLCLRVLCCHICARSMCQAH